MNEMISVKHDKIWEILDTIDPRLNQVSAFTETAIPDLEQRIKQVDLLLLILDGSCALGKKAVSVRNAVQRERSTQVNKRIKEKPE